MAKFIASTTSRNVAVADIAIVQNVRVRLHLSGIGAWPLGLHWQRIEGVLPGLHERLRVELWRTTDED
ncbi:MAG: hypothetical protein MUO50_16990 [Longimicrobiales bacterium]|nr:hypothetical protein [Longimicrobiales bacterium]